MFKINMEFTPNTNEIKQWINEIEHAILGDLTPFWDTVARRLVAEELARIFVTQGYGQWPPLSPRYAVYKSKAYPGKTMLRRKDTYFRAATRKGAGNLYERDKDKMEWGVDLEWFAGAYGFPYPVVQEGGYPPHHLPPRPVFQIAADSRALNDNLAMGLRAYLQKAIDKETRKLFK